MVRGFRRHKKHIPPDIRTYWQVIRDKVCSRCLDGDGHGNCRLDVACECPLQLYLPRIVQIVRKIKNESMEEYVRELRLISCAECKYQSATGTCRLRNEVDCALDRYFPLVIEAIETVDLVSNRSKSLIS